MNRHLKDTKKASSLPHLLSQLLFSGAAMLLLSPYSAEAELWKCMTRGDQTATYTDTPVFSDEKYCEKVETIRFTKIDKAPEARKKVSAQKTSAPPASVKQGARKKKERPKY